MYSRSGILSRANSTDRHLGVAYPSDTFLEESRVKCSSCGHVVNFYSHHPYIECSFCHNLIFRNKKCEFDFKVKRKLIK